MVFTAGVIIQPVPVVPVPCPKSSSSITARQPLNPAVGVAPVDDPVNGYSSVQANENVVPVILSLQVPVLLAALEVCEVVHPVGLAQPLKDSDIKLVAPAGQSGQAVQVPPQSTPVSVPFCIPSVQVGHTEPQIPPQSIPVSF